MEKKGKRVLILYEDEFIITVSMRFRRVWTKEKKPRIKRRFGRGKEHRVAFYAGVTVGKGELITNTAKSATTDEFLRWLKKLRDRLPKYGVLYIILDNIRSHSLGIRANPAGVNQPLPMQLPPRVKLVWLPRYAPKRNLAEQLGRIIKRELSYCYFENGTEIEEVLQRYDGAYYPSITKRIAEMCQ